MWNGETNMYLALFGILVVLGIVMFVLMPKKEGLSVTAYAPQISGIVSDYNTTTIANFTTNPTNPRALAVMSRKTFTGKETQFKRARDTKTYLESENLFDIVFKPNKDNLARADDLGGILVSRYANNRLVISTLIATEEGEPIIVTHQQYSSKSQAADAIKKFYQKLKRYFPNYIVTVVSGPRIKKAKKIDNGHTVLDDGETLIGDIEDSDPVEYDWLVQHPSSSSVDNYTKRGKAKLHGISSLNAAMAPTLSDHIPFNEQIRFQTPKHYTPNVNPHFANHIRTEDEPEALPEIPKTPEVFEGVTVL